MPPFYSLCLDVKGVKQKVPEVLSCAYLLALFKPKLNGQVWSKFSSYHVGCICHKVRIKAQRVLSSCIEVFDYFARTLIPTTLSKLQNSPDISHEEFKVGTSMSKCYCGRQEEPAILISRVLSVITVTSYRRKIWLPNLLYGISPHEGFQSRLINTVYHKRINRDGRGGLKEVRGLNNFLPRKRGAY